MGHPSPPKSPAQEEKRRSSKTSAEPLGFILKLWSRRRAERSNLAEMEFCPTCGSLLQYELPSAGSRQARFFCPTCPYVCSMESRVKITKKQHLIKKEKEKGVMSEEDQMKGLAKTEETCKKCGNKVAYFMQQQTRSADEASTIKYQCTKCEYTWVENP